MTTDQIVQALEQQTKAITHLSNLVRILIWLVVIVLFLLVANVVIAADIDVVRADRKNFPEKRWVELYYATLSRVPKEDRLQLQRALDFVVASTSSQQILERSLPVPISPTAFRMDLRQLRWKPLPKLLKEHYPYQKEPGKGLPGIVRADWLVNFLLDQRKSTAYLQLLDGDGAPNTADDIAALFGIQESKLVNNWVEDGSGVAVNKTRLLKSFPTLFRTDLWRTFDFETLNPDNDPLQNFDSKLEGAYSEWIGPLVKVSIATGDQGHLQRYALTGADGKVAAAAPIGVVVDHTPLGPELINPRSCIACHKEGLRPLNINSVKRFIDAKLGNDRLAIIAPKNSAARERIERQFLVNLESNMKYHNEQYAKIVKLITGGTPEEISDDVVAVIQRYNQDVDFATAAREIGASEERFLRTLASQGQIPARLAQLPQVPMSR